MFLVDAFSSSEAIGLGQSTSAAGAERRRPSSSRAKTPWSSPRTAARRARLGREGPRRGRRPHPVGYYKDPEKSAATFVSIDGKRYSMPGDWATVEADGTINLLGRGIVCINTGGEKVFPEEVEEALKDHDACTTRSWSGVPDEQVRRGHHRRGRGAAGAELDEAALIAHVKTHAGRVQGAQADAGRRQHRPRRQRQGRLRPLEGLRPHDLTRRRLTHSVCVGSDRALTSVSVRNDHR